ncbi:MHYT domain-containing protein [Rhodococcus chondri]|uniref:MHYT domain-containing protein n=1 Tax=Rhodococcus chondri TaxID=3065941 RepID=A0ABU7JNZ9_9NOCA|nr:MHYT domain-containing protein [Rhodococcus sp. CC-R104]MEE2031755.1 MHYT domain-containing protein [Rhodococcus sp. CC-R104]
MSHELHHFAMGTWVFFLAYLTSVVGSFVGLTCARRAATAHTGSNRSRWTFMAALSIGGVAIWLMHFIGMMGFAVPGSSVRYGLGLTIFSVVLAVGATWFGLWLLDADVPWMRSVSPTSRLGIGGVIMGFAVAGMHYNGMAAVRIQGSLDQGTTFVLYSILIGVVASITALWLSRNAEHWLVRIPAALVMGCAVVSLHYTGMAGIDVTVDPAAPSPAGMTVMSLLFPGFIVGVGVLAVPVLALMATPTSEELRREREVAAWVGAAADRDERQA